MAKKSSRKSTKPTRKPAAKKPAASRRRASGQRGKSAAGSEGESASQEIDRMIRELGDWRAKTLQKVRRIIKTADPEVIEEVKWRKPSNNMQGVPVWSHDGILCTGETYKDKVKLTFARGASLEDPSHLFNASLGGNLRRAIDIREGETIDEAALADLICAAVAYNTD